MSIFTSIGKYALISLVAFLLGISVSGQNDRDYKVLGESDTFKIGSEILPVRNIAERYRPQIYEHTEYESSKFLFMWYEAIPTNNTLILTYRPVWDDERNTKSPVPDNLYRIYRSLYYGNPPIDTEYIQIVIDSLTGEKILVRFETPEENYDYFKLAQPHYTVEISNNSNEKSFIKKIVNPNGVVISQTNLIMESKSTLNLVVATWNHLFVSMTEENINQSSSYKNVNAEMKYLKEEDYKIHRFARRSQGSFSKRVGILESLPMIIIFLIALILIDIFMFRFVFQKTDMT